MLVPNMKNEEIHKEIMEEMSPAKYHLERRYIDYNKERSKFKIAKEKPYVKVYIHQTKRKNNCLFILQKANAVDRYKNINQISSAVVMYYYTKIGIRAVRINPDKFQYVYNSHFFTRYNERLNLGLTEPLDKIIHFFTHNISSVGTIDKNNEYSAVSVDGVRLGELQSQMIVVKTFISNESMKNDQEKAKELLLADLQAKIEQELNEEDFNSTQYNFMTDSFLGLRKMEEV